MNSNWKTVLLGDIADTRLGKTLPRGSGSEEDGYPYLRNVNVRWGRVDAHDLNAMPFSEIEKLDLDLRRGDILICEGGEVGRLTVLEADMPGIGFQNAVHRVRTKPNAVPKFVGLSLEHFVKTGGLDGIKSQVTIAHLNQSKLRNLPINLPPLAEQQRIVDLIGSLDDAIEAAEGVATQADALWWSLAGELEASASNTPTVQFGEIADIGGGLTKNKKDFEKGDPIEVPYLRVANVFRRYLDLTDVATIRTTPQNLEKLRLQPGDILLNEAGSKDALGRGTVWRGEVVDCIHQNHVFRARLSDAGFVPGFVSAWSNSYGKRWFETFGTQTTIASISKATLSRFPIPAISREQQVKWAEAFESAMRAHEDAAAHGDSLRALRAELLNALLSGAHAIPETYDQPALPAAA